MFETSQHVPKTEKRCCVLKNNYLFSSNFRPKLWQNEKNRCHFVDEFQPLHTNG